MIQQYRPKEAARKLGIGESTFWLYVKEGKIHTKKLSARVTIIGEDELLRFMSEST